MAKLLLLLPLLLPLFNKANCCHPGPGPGPGQKSIKTASEIRGGRAAGRNTVREYQPPIPVPKFGNGIFHSHNCSRMSAMEFSIRIPIPEIWEWNLPFPFPSDLRSLEHLPFKKILKSQLCSSAIKLLINLNVFTCP